MKSDPIPDDIIADLTRWTEESSGAQFIERPEWKVCRASHLHLLLSSHSDLIHNLFFVLSSVFFFLPSQHFHGFILSFSDLPNLKLRQRTIWTALKDAWSSLSLGVRFGASVLALLLLSPTLVPLAREVSPWLSDGTDFSSSHPIVDFHCTVDEARVAGISRFTRAPVSPQL